MFLHHLVEHERETGRLALVDGEWRSTATPSASPSLIELVEQHSIRSGKQARMICVELSNEELGNLAGFSLATAERVVKRLREARVLDPSGKQPIVTDLPGLRKIALI